MSSSSSSEKTDGKCCIPEKFSGPCKLFKHFRKSVVSVTSQTILSTLAAGTPPTGSPTDTAVVTTSQNGFFFGGGKKNQSLILTPAAGVIVNPTLLASYNRFPATAGASGLPSGLIPNTITRASRIVVTVWGVKQKKKKSKKCKDNKCPWYSYVYEANLIGVDATANWAILHINKPKPDFNEHTVHECIERIPYFCPANSNDVCDGEEVYILGDLAASPSFLTSAGGGAAVAVGNVAKHRFMDPNGRNLAELMLLAVPGVYTPKAGSVVVNIRGQYVGMVICEPNGPTSAGSGYVAALTVRAMLEGQNAILEATRECHSKRTKVVVDPIGDFRYYTHPWLGIGYRIVDETTYLNHVVPTAAAPYVQFQPILDATSQYGLTNGPKCKRIAGIQVLSIAGNSLPIAATGATGLFVPGQPAGAVAPLIGFSSVFPPSPALGQLNVGDIIVSINDVPIGNGPSQVAPSLTTWDCDVDCTGCEGNSLDLIVRRAADDWNTTDPVIIPLNTLRPPIMESPWAWAYLQPAITAPVAVASPILPTANFINAI